MIKTINNNKLIIIIVNMQSMSNVVKIYIPRVYSNVEKKTFAKTFKNKGIGEVVYIDIYKRTNENTSYKFAFINLKLFETPRADEFLKSIKKEPTNIFYDSANAENYWVVKIHLERGKRDNLKEPLNIVKHATYAPSIQPTKIDDIFENSLFTRFLRASAKPWMPSEKYPEAFEHYANGLDLEYDELQREIYKMCCN